MTEAGGTGVRTDTMDIDEGGARPDAVIAGTLCLMSCYTQHPVAAYADKVAANLGRMASFPGLSPELRTICARLARQWDAIRAEAHARAALGKTQTDERALH
jgi:hypothetical protein